MPGLDGTGPLGEGPMTGGGRGFCNPYWRPWYGRGGWWGRGLGWRRGFAWRAGIPPWRGWYSPPYYGPYSREDEINMLKEEAAILQEELEAINKRLEELESEASE